MLAFVKSAYDLIEAASEQINWEHRFAYELETHKTKIKLQLEKEKSLAVVKLKVIQTELEDFCPLCSEPSEIKEQMENEVHHEFELKSRFIVRGMMKIRYNTFAIGMLAGLDMDMAPSNQSGREKMYNFDNYFKSVKLSFDGYIGETNKHVDLAKGVLIELIEANNKLLEAKKAMLEAAVHRQIDQFDRKVKNMELCKKPADSTTIDTNEKIVKVVEAQFRAHQEAMRQKYGRVLMRGLKNVSQQLI